MSKFCNDMQCSVTFSPHNVRLKVHSNGMNKEIGSHLGSLKMHFPINSTTHDVDILPITVVAALRAAYSEATLWHLLLGHLLLPQI